MLTGVSAFVSEIERYAGYQLRRVSLLAMTDLGRALAKLDLRVVEASVLFQIAAQPNITSSEVGRALGIKRANMAPLVAGLSNKGYVQSKPRDGRSQGLSLTEEGLRISDAARQLVAEEEARFFGGLTDAEQRQLLSLLKRVREHNTEDNQ